jgi:hypothetical protein
VRILGLIMIYVAYSGGKEAFVRPISWGKSTGHKGTIKVCGVRRVRGDNPPKLSLSAKMRNVASGRDHQKPQIRTYD